ncbi:hypothetical protein QVD17_35644 [Tagetes erecta]|uniref:SGS domain-containing protein n=1 Tax=Tagetes erecta TaxID=13708 RepID=A0AAD8JQX5_TARER|nr:hypothetical protein QVD17_35644 [Tagetes erecta]
MVIEHAIAFYDGCLISKSAEIGELPPTQSSDASLTDVVAPTSTTKDDEQVNNISTEVIATQHNPNLNTGLHEFYQKPDEVVVMILPANNVSVSYGEQILSVTIDVPGAGEDSYNFQPRLFGKIVPTKCRYDDFGNNSLVVQRSNFSTGTQRPAYPSSRPTKDWDKLEAQVKKEEKDEKLDGDAALNKFFRDIYKDADEDTRRAMRKSFVESNGTMLLTNWN